MSDWILIAPRNLMHKFQLPSEDSLIEVNVLRKNMVLVQYGPKKTSKIGNNLKDFELYQSSCIFFFCQIDPIFCDTYWLQEKSAIFTKILNYTKSSCIIFCVKRSRYSHYTHCSQEKLTHFGLRVSIPKDANVSEYAHYGVEVSAQFGIKNHKRKIRNILKDFFSYTNCL